jgi:putative tryptophan/tyrosine transport system substrate-binding protein
VLRRLPGGAQPDAAGGRRAEAQGRDPGLARGGPGKTEGGPVMERRAFLAMVPASLLAVPLAARAQSAGRPLRIAYVGGTPPPSGSRGMGAFVQGLRQLGWVEGQNIIIEQRFTGGRPERFPELIAEVLRIPVDVILVADSQAAWAAQTGDQHHTHCRDRRRCGGPGPRVQPGAAGRERDGPQQPAGRYSGRKRLQVLREIIPSLSRVAVVFNPNNPASASEKTAGLAVQRAAARTLDNMNRAAT